MENVTSFSTCFQQTALNNSFEILEDIKINSLHKQNLQSPYASRVIESFSVNPLRTFLSRNKFFFQF